MKKVKLKLPSLKSTSKGIAEDLKAIREALNVKPVKEENKSKVSVNNVAKSLKKPATEVKVENSSDTSGRPVRQRKPNQRYTDLASELEVPSRKRTISAISVASSDYAESPKKKQPKKIATSPTKKKKLTPKTSTKKRAVSRTTAVAADTEESEEGEISSPKPKHRRPVSLSKKQVSEDEDEDIDEEEQFVPPPRVHEDDDDEDEDDYGYNNSSSADADKPKRKYVRSGKYSKKSQSKKEQTSIQTAATTTVSRVAAFEAPPEFDDDDDGKQRQIMDTSPMFGSGPTSSMTMGHQTACDYMYDDRRQVSSSQQHYMGDNIQYGGMSPSQMMGSGMMQQGVSLADYSSQSQITQNTNQNYASQNQYDDTYEEGPALVYGPGPRTITYNGEYYFLSPIPPKRRISQGPRPRSSRYKPFSATYKPPDVYKYRERLKLLRKKQQRSQMPKRRSFDFYGGGMGDEDYQFPSQRVYRRQMDETDHALEALKSTIGGNEEDDVGLMAAGASMYGSSSTAADDYFGPGDSTSALGMIGGSSGPVASDWDNAAASRASYEPETRARGRGRGGRRPGTLLGGRKRRTTDEFSSRGVYADDSAADDNYRFTFGPSHTSKKRSSMATTSKFDGNLSDEGLGSMSNEVTGDHCYIKRPVGVGFGDVEDLGGVTVSVQTRVTPAATLMDVQPDSYVFAQNSSFPFDNQVGSQSRLARRDV